MTIEEMQQRKRELGLTYEEIAQRCGLSVPTVQRIISGATQNPREYTKKQIEKALVFRSSVFCREEAFAYMSKKQGQYTADDYYQLPDDQRCELIDGVIYDLAAPTWTHQTVSLEICVQLKDFIKKNGGRCLALVSPVDVKLEKQTIVQPDVLVFCDREGRRRRKIPDFVAEVTSPSTRSRDYILKLSKYMASGVSEYWVVDLKKEQITVYLFKDELETVRYGLYDKIPVSIWDGRCVVDLSEARQSIDFSGELDAEEEPDIEGNDEQDTES